MNIDSGHIEAAGVTKVYEKPGGGTVVAVGDVSFRAEEGSFVAIVGPSGCGKSTLLKLIAGLVSPDSGAIRIGGKPAKEGRRDVCIMLQTPALLPWKNVLENVLMPYVIWNEMGSEQTEVALSMLDRVGLADFAENYPWQLSGGMQQRTGLARLLVMGPEVALLDEPFGALDELTRADLNLELRQLHNETGATTVLITHSVEEAVFLADEVVIMAPSPGRLVGTVKVDLPQQREPNSLTSHEFHAAVDSARSLLMEESRSSTGNPSDIETGEQFDTDLRVS